MNESIPLKFRLLSAGYFVMSSYPVSSSFLAVVLTTFGTFASNVASQIISLAYMLIFIMIAISWFRNKETHPFLTNSRKAAINYALSNLLAIVLCALICIFVFLTTCGIGNSDMMPLIISLVVFACVMIAYSINSIVAAIFALRGYTFKSFLIYSFIRHE